MRNVRIMIFNVGYLTGITSFFSVEYFFKIHHLMFPSNAHREKIARGVAGLIEKENPDIVFLAEIRNERYIAAIQRLFMKSYVDAKYGPGSMLHRMPFFCGNCNALFLKKSLPVSTLFLGSGTKKLVYRVDISENFSAFFVHLALGKSVRRKQFAEIAGMVGEVPRTKHVIVAGDFNIFGGFSELQELTDRTGLCVVNHPAEHTFPTSRPRHTIDLILASPGLQVAGIHIHRDVFLSNHLPVCVDLKFEP